ncbi:MAG TPA: hypothetical protein VG297_20765 [Bryobacteraceae bacterium]|jgi:hypothetical protein|nr:hypothetical protein [Bryobacteraceae bacterium]
MTKKQRLQNYVTSRGWAAIAEPEWLELRTAFPDFSEATLRGCGLRIEPPWSGIAAHTLAELEESLRDYSRVYADRPDLGRYCRDQVIAAKERARWASKSSRVEESKRRLKAEMVEWMLVWLGDPATFPVWAALRKDIIIG